MCNTKRKRGRGEERWLELRHELRLMEASHSSISATQRHGQARGCQPPAAGGAPAGCVARLVSMLPRCPLPHRTSCHTTPAGSSAPAPPLPPPAFAYTC